MYALGCSTKYVDPSCGALALDSARYSAKIAALIERRAKAKNAAETDYQPSGTGIPETPVLSCNGTATIDI